MSRIAVLTALALALLAACSGNELVPPDGGGSADAATVDAATGGDAGAVDAGDDTDGGGGGASCAYLADCAANEDCVAGVCKKAPRCHCETTDEKRCLCGVTSQGDTQCAPYQFCLEGRMVLGCRTDEDCAADAWCHSGVCEPFAFAITAPEPNAGGTKTTLKAGYGEVLLDFPVGVSMAGYGARKGPKTPYNKELGGSTGFYDRPVVKAIVLDNGAERVALLRLTTSWSTDYMNTMVAKKLADRLGENYIAKIVSSTGHSHSYPARFWTTAYGMGLGVFGYDQFMWEIFDRITTSYADAIVAAVEDLSPAKVGWATDDNFDPEDHVTRSRADDTFGDGNKDKKFLALRVDHVGGPGDGKTKALLMVYGSHGTHMMDTLITGDAPGAAEQIAEERFDRDLGYRVPVLFFNGDAGNTAPSGGDELRSAPITGDPGDRGDSLLVIQAAGERLYPYLKEKYDGITDFTADPEMKIATKWVPISRKHLGYADDEFYLLSKGEKKPYWNGAFQCAGKFKEEGWEDGNLGCLLVMDDLNLGASMPEFSKTRLSVLRVGGLVLATMPGEATTPAGKKLVEEIRKATGLSDVFSIGYAQNHHEYILTPDYWFKGSYEASMNIWGWKEGDYFIAESTALATSLKDVSKATPPVSTVRPSWYRGVIEEKTVTPTATTAGTPGTFSVQPPAAATKGDVLVVEWHGGHPGTGAPRVFLEVKDQGGAWSTLTTAGGRDYDDTHFHMIIEYRGNYKDNHDWRATWQEQVMIKGGTYRFRADGLHWDGAKAVAYGARSSEFALDDQAIEIRDLARSGGNVTFKVNYPPPPQTGTFRLNSVYAPITLGAPLDNTPAVKLDVACGADTYAAAAAVPVLSADKESRTDAAGKAWNVRYTTVAFPDPATGACEYDITVTDPWGNTGRVKKAIP